MTLAVWPDYLRQNMTAPEYGTSLAEARLRTPMEVGPAKYRARVSAAPRPISGDIRCTEAQKACLEWFWREDLRLGVLPFLFPSQEYFDTFLLTEDDEILCDEDDEPLLLADWEIVQFAVPPAFKPRQRSTIWTATLSLSVLP